MEAYSRVGDLPVLHGDIKVNADKDAFIFEINVSNGEFVGERHGLGTMVRKIRRLSRSYLSSRK